MDDLISRQDAIDEVFAWLKDRMSGGKNGKPLTERLKELPAAQPELIRCKDCKYWYDAPASDGYNSCEKDALIRHKDFYCAEAERKEADIRGDT